MSCQLSAVGSTKMVRNASFQLWASLYKTPFQEESQKLSQTKPRGQCVQSGAHAVAEDNWRASKASETLSGVYKFELVRYMCIYIYIYIYIYFTHAHKMDQSDRSVGVDYLSIFYPNNPSLVLGMLVGCIATDTSSSN